MTWQPDAPADTELANTIHTHIQNTKTMIRERMEGGAHIDADQDDAGMHEAGKRGFVTIHASTAAMQAYTPKVPCTLHTTTDYDGLWIVNEAQALVLIVMPDHDSLEGLDDDDHVEFQTLTWTRAMTHDLQSNTTIEVEESNGGATDSLPLSHREKEWYVAHGKSLTNDNFTDGAINARYLVSEINETSPNNRFTNTGAGNFSWPWMTADLASSGGLKFWTLGVRTDNQVGYYDYLFGDNAPISIAYGRFYTE